MDKEENKEIRIVFDGITGCGKAENKYTVSEIREGIRTLAAMYCENSIGISRYEIIRRSTDDIYEGTNRSLMNGKESFTKFSDESQTFEPVKVEAPKPAPGKSTTGEPEMFQGTERRLRSYAKNVAKHEFDCGNRSVFSICNKIDRNLIRIVNDEIFDTAMEYGLNEDEFLPQAMKEAVAELVRNINEENRC